MTPIVTKIRPTFRATGSVRGYGPRRTTPGAALRDVMRDRRACRSLGGGAYSDREPAVTVAGDTYSVLCSEDALTSEYGVSLQELMEIVGAEIAAGRGTRRPRLRRDDWAGWVVAGGALYRVSVQWPDGAESLDVLVDFAHICDVL